MKISTLVHDRVVGTVLEDGLDLSLDPLQEAELLRGHLELEVVLTESVESLPQGELVVAHRTGLCSTRISLSLAGLKISAAES